MSDTFTDSDFYGSDGGEQGNDDVVEAQAAADVDLEVAPAPVSAEAATDGQGEPEIQPEKTYLDFTSLEGQFARLKVGDEEIDVPATELPQWAMRQADYTRKTQELAQQREQLEFWTVVEQAMQQDPAATLAHLQQRFGVNAAPAAAEVDEDEWTDPTEQKLMTEIRELRAQLAPALEYTSRQEAIGYVDQVVKGLETKYADFGFNAEEVLNTAVERGIQDPNLLEAVYRDMLAEKQIAYIAATATAKQTTAAKDGQKRDAKQAAANATSASGGAVRSGVQTEPAVQPKTPREAFDMAMRSLRESGEIT